MSSLYPDKAPPLLARIFGRWGRNMDGHTLLTFGRSVWQRNRWNRKWTRLCP